MIENGRRVWKQLQLMEDAMLIHRIMRAPEKRIFKIDIGNINPNEVDNYMQKIINKMKKTPFVDKNTGDYNLKYNIQNLTEDFFLPVRGGDSGTSIDNLSGLEYTAIEDIDYLKAKLFAALKIPKAFLGYEEDVNGKATLAAQDVRFARTIERIQRIIISELHKIAIVHLSAQGFENAELVDFELSMTSPSTIYEQEKLTLYNTKVDLAGSMVEKKLMPRDWIFKNIFNFSAEEIEEIELGIIQDQKETFRMTKIAEEGEDPLDTFNKEKEAEGSEGEEEGAEGGEEAGGEEAEGEKEQGANPFAEGVNDDLVKDYDRRSKNRNTPKVPEGGWPGAGRPKEGVKYNTHEHPRGYDPIGKVAWKNARNESMNVIKKYGLEKLVTKKTKLLSEQSSIIDESNILPEEI
jgi:hypothetical protein